MILVLHWYVLKKKSLSKKKMRRVKILEDGAQTQCVESSEEIKSVMKIYSFSSFIRCQHES